MTSKRPRLKSGFSLGGEQAEADPLLQDAFFETGDFDVISSRSDPRCFVVGRTGAGKSAAMQRLEELQPNRVIRIVPEDLSMPYIIDLGVFRFLDSIDVHLDLLWIALWKHVLLVEIIRHRYNVDSPVAKQNVFNALRDKLRRDPAKQAALAYLDEFQGRFWCEADERVREITDNFAERINAEAGGSVTSGGISGTENKATTLETSAETRTEQAARFQRIVNETQLGRLNKMLAVINDDILDSAQHYTYVVIDDLDRDWVDERLANDLIRCLFRTVLDLQRVTNLKVLVALRTNIFGQLDFGTRSGGQEEKFRALVLDMRWTRDELEELLNARLRAAGPPRGINAASIRELLPSANRTRGNPVDYIIDRTLLRPRDAIAFGNECMAVGAGKARLTWADIHRAERAYSTKRLLALRDEWKSTYPGVDRVFEKFRRTPTKMSREDFQKRLDDVMLLLSDPSFEGVVWLSQLSEAMWAPGEATWFQLYQPLLKMLFGIGFIGCASVARARPTFYLDDPLLVDSEAGIERCDAFFVHRTFHRALDIETPRE